MNMKLNYCNSCGYLSEDGEGCRLFQIKVNKNEDFCSKHKKELDFCEVCGSALVNAADQVLIENGENWKVVCKDCAHALGTCRTCQKARTCLFEQSSNPLPKVVMRTMQQGNMTVQTQVKNPERIAATCSNCECYKNGECLRESGAGCELWI